MRTLLMILLASVVAFAQEGVPKGPAQGPPPKNLTKQADGHFSANTEPASTADFEIHVVVPGDTLSRLSVATLNDMKLWPQLWEQNAHIVNPHWIYPNDKILIRKVTPIAAAEPPPPPPEPVVAPPPPDPPFQPSRVKLVAAPVPQPIPPARSIIDVSPARTFPQVKASDLYCSGFIRSVPVASDLKVTAVVDTERALLAGDGNYVYLSQGSQSAIKAGATYQVIRPTRRVDSPTRPAQDRDLGMHYLQIAQIRVVTVQDVASTARVTESCEAVEAGDLVVPYTRAPFPALPERRTFSSSMRASGQAQGKVVMGMSVLLNSGSVVFKGSSRLAGAGQGALTTVERGIAGEGNVVYVDVGRQNAKPGDLFIVFRDTVETASDGTKETHRNAVGELVILGVEDRAATALVTYSTDAIALGDSVERR
jgi:hypothetical protein